MTKKFTVDEIIKIVNKITEDNAEGVNDSHSNQRYLGLQSGFFQLMKVLQKDMDDNTRKKER